MTNITCIALEPSTCDILIGYSNGYLVEADGLRTDDLMSLTKRTTESNRIRSSTFVGNRPLIACAYIVPSSEETSLVYSSPSVVEKRLCIALSEVGYLAVVSLICGSVLRCVPTPLNSHRMAVCGATVFLSFYRAVHEGDDDGDESGEMSPRKVLVLNAMTTVTADKPSKWKSTEGGSMMITPMGLSGDKNTSVVDMASHPQSPFVVIAYEVSKDHRSPHEPTYSVDVVLHLYHSQSSRRYEPYNTFSLNGIAAETSGADKMSRFLAVTFLPTIVRKDRSEGTKKSDSYGNLLLAVLQSSRVSIVDFSVPTCAVELFHFNACHYNPFTRIATLQSDPYGCIVTTKGGVWKRLTFDDCSAVATRVLTEVRTTSFDSNSSGGTELAVEQCCPDLIPGSHALPGRCSNGCWKHSAKLLSAAVSGSPFDAVVELRERRANLPVEEDSESIWSTTPIGDCSYGATIVSRLYPTHCNVTSIAQDLNGALLSINVDLTSLDINSARITCAILSKPESVIALAPVTTKVTCSATTVFIATSPIRQRSAPTVVRWGTDGVMAGVIFDAYSTARVAKLDGMKQSHPILYLAYFSVTSDREGEHPQSITFSGHNIISSFRVAEEPSVLLDARVDQCRCCVWCVVCPRVRAPMLRQYSIKVSGKEISTSEGIQATVDVTCSGIVVPQCEAPFLILQHDQLCMIELVDVKALSRLATLTVPSRNGTHQLLESCVCYQREGLVSSQCWIIVIALRVTRVVGDGVSRSHLRVLQCMVDASCRQVRVVADGSLPSELPCDNLESPQGIRQTVAITIVKSTVATHLSVADLRTGETWLVAEGESGVMFPLTEVKSRNVVLHSSVSTSPSIWTVPATSRNRCVRLRRKRQAMEQRILQDAFVTTILKRAGGKTVQQSHLWLQRWLSERSGLFEVDGHDDAAVTAGPHCMSASCVDSRVQLLLRIKNSIHADVKDANRVATEASEIERLLLECLRNEGRVSAFDKMLFAELGIGTSMLLEAALKEYECFLTFSEDTVVCSSTSVYERLEKSVASLLSISSQSAEVPRSLFRSVESFLRNCKKDMDSVRSGSLSDDELCWWLHRVSWSLWGHRAQRQAIGHFKGVVEAQKQREVLKRTSFRDAVRERSADGDSNHSAIVAVAKWASDHGANAFPVRDILGVGGEYRILLSNAVVILETILGSKVEADDITAHLPSSGVRMNYDVLLRLRQTDVFPRKLDLSFQCCFNGTVARDPITTQDSAKWSSIVPSASTIANIETTAGKADQATGDRPSNNKSAAATVHGEPVSPVQEVPVEVKQQQLREEYLRSYRGVGHTAGDADFDSDGDDTNIITPGAIRLKGEIRIKKAQQNDMPNVIEPFPTVPKVVGVNSSVEFAGLFNSIDATAANGSNQGAKDLFAALLSVQPSPPSFVGAMQETTVAMSETNPSASLFPNPSMQSQSSAQARRRITHMDPQLTHSQEMPELFDKALQCFRNKDYTSAYNIFTSTVAASRDESYKAKASAYCGASRCLEKLKVHTPVVSTVARYAVQTDGDALNCAGLLHESELEPCDHLMPAYLLAEYFLQENLRRSLRVVLTFIRFSSDRSKDHFVGGSLSTAMTTQQYTNDLLGIIGVRLEDYAAAVANEAQVTKDHDERDMRIAATLERMD